MDRNGEIGYGLPVEVENPTPLQEVESLMLPDVEPETIIIGGYQQEYVHFGDKRTGFSMLGRHFGKYFFRVTSGNQTPVFCDTDLLLRDGVIQPAIRARINFLQPGELEQFGLGALREL